MKVTKRDLRVLAKLAAARWLTTRQIAALCYPAVSLEMARRRLRLMRASGYAHTFQINEMTEALHSLGAQGKTLLLKKGWERPIRLERRPPRNLEHFVGINDLRVAVERQASARQFKLNFFFACWELQAQRWPYSLIPDAACSVECEGKNRTILFEFDRGEEAPGFMLRTKFMTYARGFDGLTFSKVVVVVQTPQRLRQLQKYVAAVPGPQRFQFCLAADLERLLDSD